LCSNLLVCSMSVSSFSLLVSVILLHVVALRFSQETCDSSWPSSSRHDGIVGSITNAAVQHEELPGDVIHNLFISPESNFAFCYIAKNGCTSWAKLLNNVDELNPSTPWRGDQYLVADKSQRKHGEAARSKIFSDPTAIRAVFLRDPMARFVSAFLGKCIASPHENNHKKCFDPSAASRGHVFMRDAVEWATGRDMSAVENPHWRLQIQHCGLRDHFDAYTHIGFITKDTYNSDAKCLVHTANIDQYNIHKGKPVFGRGVKTKHHAKSTESNDKEMEYLKSLFTKEAANRLYTSLASDYEFFNFSKPTWIDKATGQYYNTTVPMNVGHTFSSWP